MSFFLGTRLDGDGDSARVDYKPKHLTTHGLIFGMTGSGKTGLAIGMLEEASRNDIPVIAIDPKGDLTNLALSWPNLDAEHFGAWVDPAKLESGKNTAAELGAKTANIWREGLAADGLGSADIETLRGRTHVTVYTPGSSAGVQVSMLDRFDPPKGYASMPSEDRGDLIAGIVSAILALIDVEADPLQSKEYILLSEILRHAWERGETLDLPGLIQAVATPPMAKLGVFDMDTFYSPKHRQAFAMKLNALVASPSFEPWLKGVPLDVERLLARDGTGSRTSIFSIAHLDDNERMSFVSLLLDRIIAWMRAQPGTGELRALLYFDEVFGYLPPYPKNPPTKRPLLTILKQARAFGLGALLATQNPVDIDYKAITNAGTWLIGKLQTEQDKERILDGLMGASATSGQSRSDISNQISALQGRQFLLQNAHVAHQTVFRTRFVMSYLRGPMTRHEIIRLRDLNFYNLPETAGLAPFGKGAKPEAAPAAPTPKSDGTHAAPGWGAGPNAAQPSPPRRGSDVVVDAHFESEFVEISQPGRPTSSDQASVDILRRGPGSMTSPNAPRTQQSHTRPKLRGLEQRYLAPRALQLPAVQALLGATPEPGIGDTLYRPALVARVKLSFQASGTNTTYSAGEVTRIAYPLPYAPGLITWRATSDLLGAEHGLIQEKPGLNPRYEAPASWVLSPADRARAKDVLFGALSGSETLHVPACPPLGRYGEPGESLNAFKARLAVLVGEATDRVRDGLADKNAGELALWDRQLEELRELLQMDKREIALVKESGDARALQRVKNRATFRMGQYKELKGFRQRAHALGSRAMADAEFSAIDKLEACTMAELRLARGGAEAAWLGIVWIPNR
ncbi:MAG: hypothetical protein ACI9MR_000460 [Myxococcota bacterium]|jgi:hypothetical protein